MLATSRSALVVVAALGGVSRPGVLGTAVATTGTGSGAAAAPATTAGYSWGAR
ncbi:MAG: hypothetical protein M0Z42_08460 [Actinomycetota bacterium]|nr:hypothetical protein [Actinomycetota bacterium]